MFRVDRSRSELTGVREVDYSDFDVQERKDIQEWVEANPNMVGEDLLFIGKEFSGFDRTRERPDLLAIDGAGCLVVIELKRDDSGTDVHWQAIKYASYMRQATVDDIVGMLAEYKEIDEEEATHRLSEHLQTDEIASVLNNDQRIILASHRFPPEVTSASLWLNEKAARALLTCVTLTPYAGDDETLHVLASTIVPVPAEAALQVGIGATRGSEGPRARSEIRYRNQGDGVTEFLRRVAESANEGVRDELRPDKTSRWAGGNGAWRYYHLWYQRPPWQNWNPAYRIEMYPEVKDYPVQIDEAWTAWVGFVPGPVSDQIDLNALAIHEDEKVLESGIWVQFEACQLNDDLADRMAAVLAKFVNSITPLIDDLGNEIG